MRILLLGTAGYHPNEERQTACVLLPQAGIMFDAGTAAFRIPRHLVSTELDVFLSHAHLDHIVGLTYLLSMFGLGELTKVRIHATQETIDAVCTHLFSDRVFPILPPFEFRPLQARIVDLANGRRVTWQTLPNHPNRSTAFRLDWNDGTATKSMAYVTDTIADGSYTNLIQGVDLLIHECTFPDSDAEWAERTGHSYTSQVLSLAAQAGAKSLVLTHFDPRLNGADPVELAASAGLFPGTVVGADGLEIDV